MAWHTKKTTGQIRREASKKKKAKVVQRHVGRRGGHTMRTVNAAKHIW